MGGCKYLACVPVRNGHINVCKNRNSDRFEGETDDLSICKGCKFEEGEKNETKNA